MKTVSILDQCRAPTFIRNEWDDTMEKKPIMFSLLLVITCCMFMFASCGDGPGPSENAHHGSGAIPLHLTWEDSAKEDSMLQQAQIDCAEQGVQTVIANVYKPGGNSPIVSGAWACEDHRGIIRDVPAGSYSVVVMGRDADDQVLYRAEAIEVEVPAGGSADPVALELKHFVPALAPPCNGITLQWESVTHAVDYEVSISENSDMSDAVAYTAADNSYTPADLNEGALYYWHVKANDLHANQSSSSEIGCFIAGNANFMFDISNATSGSYPSQMIAIDDVLYFTAYGQKSEQYLTGSQLFKYDGSTVSTIEIDPSGESDPIYLTEFNNQLYFVATDNNGQDRELWRYNGTGATKIDVDGTGSSEPNHLTIYRDSLYFTANVENGRGLFRYNGMAAAPEQIYFFTAARNSSPCELAVANDQLYIRTCRGYKKPWQLFKFNGAEEPIRIDDGNLLNPSSRLTASNNQLYFKAAREVKDENGKTIKENELYRHDGTDSAPIKIDICSGTCSSNLSGLTDVNGVLYFSANIDNDHELFRYTGTGDIAEKIDINTLGSSTPINLTNVNGTLYFSAAWPSIGREPSYYDGQKAYFLADIRNGEHGSDSSDFSEMNGIVYFRADDGVNGDELWSFNEPTHTIQMEMDICPGKCSSRPTGLTSVSFQNTPMLFFSANNVADANGSELWSVGDAGTTQVVDLNTSGGGTIPSRLSAVNDKLYFRANSGFSGTELWESDGTIAGTRMAIDLNPGPNGSYPEDFTEYNGKLYFRATSNGDSFGLWEYNGASAQEITGSDDLIIEFPANLTVAHDILYFTAGDGGAFGKVFQFDGNTAAKINTEPYVIDDARHLTAAANGLLYFSAVDAGNDCELYKYNGSIVTRININEAGSSHPSSITPLGENVYFSAEDGSGSSLFKYNGIALQKITINRNDGSNPRSLIIMGGNLYCIATCGGRECLYKYDGDYLTRIDKITKDDRSLHSLSSTNEMLYMIATTAAADGDLLMHELWKSDGTAEGTQMVEGLGSYNRTFYGSEVVEFNGKIYFLLIEITSRSVGPSFFRSYSMWSSDGNGAEIVMSADFQKRCFTTDIIELEKTKDALFFTHYDPEHGPGLWKLCP
jgi:ELWxxDGT repeat protein